MPGQPGTRVAVVTLNTRGVPVIGSRLAGRYAVIGSAIEAGDADVVCFQEEHRLPAFNVDRGSCLLGGFLAGTGLADAFDGGCPATFRAEYLPPGKTPHCIDFILTSDRVNAEAADVIFADKEPLPHGPGYVSDHVGLRADLVVRY